MDGLQALTGMDGEGEYVLTPVGSDATRVGDGDRDRDRDVNCAGSDGGSEESGESIEEGGGTGSGAAPAAPAAPAATAPAAARGGGGAGAEAEDNHGRQKRVAKLARGLSHVGRLMKKRPVGASEAHTIGRASLRGDDDNSYLRAHDFDGEGARSYSGRWGKGASSPEHSR